MSNNKFSIGKLLAALIVMAWLGAVGYYIIGNTASVDRLPEINISSENLEEEWYSVLFHGEKAGWVHVEYDELPEGYRFRSSTLFKMLVQGIELEAKILLSAQVNSRLELQKFSLDFTSDLQDIHVDGEIVGKELTYRIESPKGSKPRVKKVLLTEVPRLMDMVGRHMAQDGIEVGQKIEVPVFDPITQRNDRAVAEVLRKETVEVMSEMVETYVVRVRYLGIEMHSWLDEDGRAVKSDAAMGFSMILVSKEEALQLEGAGKIDVIAISAVPVDVSLKNSGKLKYLKVKLSGVEGLDDLSLDGGHQRLEDQVLEVEIPELGSGYTLPDEDSDREAERSPEDLIQSDDPDIIEAARKAIGDATDSIEAAKRINEWLFKNIKKQNAFTIPSAREVLQTMEGDCNEHTQLYVAMARAVGLPARISAGVVYLRGAFYYHAWPEVWLGDEPGWVPVDPTFGQFPADATHLRLVEGSLKAQADIVRFVGKLNISVIDYR